MMRRRALLAASMQSVGGKIDNLVSIVASGTRCNIIFEYPCDVPLRVILSAYELPVVSIPAGTSLYALGRAPEIPGILEVEPQSDSIYNYTW